MGRSHDRVSSFAPPPGNNPISMIEEYAIDQEWNSERTNENELWAEIPSQWGNQRLWAAFHEDMGFLQVNCYLNIKIPPRFVKEVAHTITLINERIWLGHFEIWGEEQSPVFRVVVPLRGSELTVEQMEDIIAAVYQEMERFFPTFQWVIWGGKKPDDAVAATIVETEGEA
ncbi:MAG: YbjN domain-containing protein [Magnetococcales bacterium]|nr:YbjN domain-containing protein [Magnetococcales bacterium]